MIYLYLTKRDKKDVKLVTLLQGECPTAMRVADLKALALPESWTLALEAIVASHRNHFDLWMESAPDVMELQKRLRARGHRHVPIMTSPMVWLSSVPTGAEIEKNDRFIKGNYAPEISPLALKKMHLAHERLRRVTP